eukprot:4303395-Prymnesium_polylepis.1
MFQGGMGGGRERELYHELYATHTSKRSARDARPASRRQASLPTAGEARVGWAAVARRTRARHRPRAARASTVATAALDPPTRQTCEQHSHNSSLTGRSQGDHRASEIKWAAAAVCWGQHGAL